MASSAQEGKNRKIAAYHEAGHAVAAYHLGEPRDILSVRIFPTDGDYGGFIGLADIPEVERHRPESEPRIRRRLTVLMAGRAAEEKATGRSCPGSARLDINEAHPLYIDAGFADGAGTDAEDGTIAHDNDESLYTEWLEEARNFMEGSDHWAEVEALKNKLLGRERLSGPEACDAIRNATQRPSSYERLVAWLRKQC